MLDICTPCYEKIIAESESEEILDEQDIDSIIESMENGVMTDEQILQLSEDMNGDGRFIDDEGEGEGVWVDSTDGPIYVEEGIEPGNEEE